MTVTEVPFALAPIPGKGIAVIATQPIPANTLLFTETPLLLLTGASHSIPTKTRFLNEFERLPKDRRAVLLLLCSNLPEGQQHSDEAIALGVWKANNFCLDDEGTVNGLFALAARLNHSCIGGENCRWEYDHDEGTMSFWTDKDVMEGEELTHCYRTDWRMGTKNRREALMEEYGFWCRCRTCEEPEEDD